MKDDLRRAVLRGFTRERDGKTTSRPALLITDGVNMTYGVNVQLDDDASTELLGVPIARANRDIFYGAEVGSPCRLRRTASGQWEVVGFSRSMPGTFHSIPVTVPNFVLGPASATVIGAPVDQTLSVRPVTFGDLATLGGFGIVPLGVLAAYRGGVFQEYR